MYRSAWTVLLLGLLLAGCTSNVRHEPLPLPDAVYTPARKPPERQVPLVITPPVRKPPTPPSSPLIPDGIDPPRGIRTGNWRVLVVHHSATTNGSPQSIDREHRARGWDRGLGYHFVIGNGVDYPDGKIFVGPRWSSQVTGAHCKSSAGVYFGTLRPGNFFNDRGIGICLIGNFQSSEPTPKQMASLVALTEALCARTGIAPNQIYGHGQVTNKTVCPGAHLRSRIAELRSTTARRLAAQGLLAPDRSFVRTGDELLPDHSPLDAIFESVTGLAQWLAPDRCAAR